MKIILEGDFTISDETGQKVTCGPGDVLNFPKGSKIRFTTEKGGLAFYTGQVRRLHFRSWPSLRGGAVDGSWQMERSLRESLETMIKVYC